MSNENQVIYQGEDRILKAFVKKSDGTCFDITGYTATATFVGTSGDVAVSAVVIANDPAGGDGQWQITLSDTDTAAMKIGNQSFELVMVSGADTRIVQYINSLTITPSLF